jgi:very-short-patch-repair endonuclease
MTEMVFPSKIKRFRPKITKAEYQLRNRLKKGGIPFQAQAKIHTKSGRNYLVDLLIDNHLVVEVGYVGITDIQENQDLQDSGYTVLHFKNEEVLRNLKTVVETIKKMREHERI